MGEADIRKQFLFNNRADDLYTLLMVIMDFFEGTDKLNDASRFKLKVILTELLTNGIKHSGGSESFLDITIAGSEVCIVKSDFGNTFVLTNDGIKREWPLPGRHTISETKRVYGDDNFTLMAKIENNCAVSFFIEELPLASLPAATISNLPEHFGLMMITKACDSFRYCFDIDTCTNKFIAVVNI